MAVNARVAVARSGKRAPIKPEHKVKLVKEKPPVKEVKDDAEKLIKEVKNGDKRKTSSSEEWQKSDY